jgi:hypothetical protein
MSRHHIAILLAFGPEVRAFVHSGLAKALARTHRVTLIAAHPGSRAFEPLDDLPVIGMPLSQESGLLQRVRYWSEVLHEEWLRSRQRQRWRHYLAQTNSVPPGGATSRMLARAVGARHWVTGLAHGAERWCGTHWGTQPEWRGLYEAEGIDSVLTASYSSQRTLPALQTAANLGLKTVVVTNSWKAVYSKPYVPVVPDCLALWSASAAADLESVNPHVPPEKIAVCGSLHLERFLHPGAIMDRAVLCAKLGLDAARPFICYTAAAPAAVRNEEYIVQALLRAIESIRLPGRPQVLLRLNPMEDGARFRALAERYRDLRVQKPVWEWDPHQDWCCALPQDSDLWLATVCHSALNVSIASTVTLEFGAVGRPVVNVCFDLPEAQPAAASNRRFWEADFYREIRESGVAVPAFSEAQLLAHVSDALRSGAGSAAPSAPVFHREPVRAALNLIDSALSG